MNDQTVPDHDAYDEGYDAYWVGVDDSENPHEEDSDGHRSWEAGWRAARQHDYDESEGCFVTKGRPMRVSSLACCLVMALTTPAWSAEDFAGANEIRLTHGDLGSPKAKTVVIKDKANIGQLVGTIKWEKKEPCACDHIDWAVFVKDRGEIKVSLCDHCFDIGQKTYRMPPEFFKLYTAYMETGAATEQRGPQEGRSTKTEPKFTHVVVKETAYYKDGPQQARPPDGKLPAGTNVSLIRAVGSYSLVRSDGGIEAYVAADTLAALPQGHRDVGYAEPKNERQSLDVYVPAAGKGHPIIFWIHGGGWQRGDKADVQAKPQAFVDKGFVFVSTNYRFVPNVTIKQMAGDIAKAIRWVHDNARQYGGDPEAIFVMGHSAGAQLAALVCTDDRYLKREGLSLSVLRGCVPVDGDTYDVPMQIRTVEKRRADIYRWKFGDEESQKDLSPVTHVAKGKHIPPFLILHVAAHPETKAQSQRIAKALQEAGISAKAVPAQGKNHITINADLGGPDDGPTKVLFEFLDAVLKKK